jgi:hypothetical protein
MLQMSRRRTERRVTGRAELAGLALVLIAGTSTAWWAGQRVGIDMSGLNTAARVLGLFDRAHPLHETVGYEPNGTLQAGAAAAPAAAFCENGQTPSFALGALDLRREVGDAMGTPIECAHPSSGGDTIQQTTTGLVDYRADANTVTFTDGWRHWALTPQGVLSWEGTQPDPPTG